MKVVIIGSGNVATVLGRKIASAGHEIVQIAGRTAEKAITLASLLKTAYTTNFRYINTLADIYVIAVSDRAIESIVSELTLNDKLVVHTAAAVRSGVLKKCTKNFGVLYPLQSLKQEMAAIPPIPILVDGNSEAVKETLIKFATGWADSVQVATDEERLKLHLSAVFVNNFTNHIFSLVESYCSLNCLEYSQLGPLIHESMLGGMEARAIERQTGPAIRKDYNTIIKHQDLLSSEPLMLDVYNVMTNSIVKFYELNKGVKNSLEKR